MRFLIALIGLAAVAAQPPVIPVGADAYLQWARWPYLRTGERAYMRSTYDRNGGNERADASHFLYQEADDFNVTLDVESPGVLYFVRYNHWHGSPWHYEVDGKDRLVQETTTADPLHPAPGSTFLPASAFPKPLAWTWADTKGADLSWVPIGFTQSFRMAYSRTFYGTGYYIYDQFVKGAKLSRPIAAWDGGAPDARVVQLIGRAGSDLAPAGSPAMRESSGRIDIPAGQTVAAYTENRGARMVRAIELSVPRDRARAFSDVRLRVTWDGRTSASIDAPIGLFFGAGVLYNRENKEYLVKSFPMVVRYGADRVYLSCYFPMPFFRSARMELIGGGAAVKDVEWKVRSEPYRDSPSQVGYFHATYRDHPNPEPGRDLVLLDTTKTEGGGDWSGQFAGTSLIFSHAAVLNTLEGDPRFFFDDSNTPQGQGTGTEEWGGGGDYWGGENMTLPFAGHPVGAKNPQSAVSEDDRIESAYRFLLADLMPFGKNAHIQLEHGGMDESTQHYETVTYWYGLPAASLVRTDELIVGDEASERRHGYSSPDASAPYAITSRYEWGPDHLQGREIYPAETDHGRTTTGTSEFTLRIDPKNAGVMLRRKLDYSFPNQRAEVFVADGGGARANWKPAGIWYLAGSNTAVFSNPRGELGATQHVVETSNRRFRDDEFLLPLALTKGRRTIRVRVRFTPVKKPLFPGNPLPDLAWSEMRYTAWSFVIPQFRP